MSDNSVIALCLICLTFIACWAAWLQHRSKAVKKSKLHIVQWDYIINGPIGEYRGKDIHGRVIASVVHNVDDTEAFAHVESEHNFLGDYDCSRSAIAAVFRYFEGEK